MAEFGVIHATLRGIPNGPVAINENDINLISSLAPFCRPHEKNLLPNLSAQANHSVIRSLQLERDRALADENEISGEFERSWRVFSALHASLDTSSTPKHIETVIITLELAASRLISVRDVLASALCELREDRWQIDRWLEQDKHSLSRIFLSGAHLRKAELCKVNLSEAHLQGADMIGVNLQEANLSYAHMQCSNLHNAMLQKAGLSYADMRNVDLTSAKASEIFAAHADFTNANLSNALMQWAELSSAELAYADLSGTNLQGAFLYGTRLHGAQFNKTLAHGVQYGADTSGELTVFPVGLEVGKDVVLKDVCDFPASAESIQQSEILRRLFSNEK